MKMNACKVMTRIWKIDHHKDSKNCVTLSIVVPTTSDAVACSVNNAIRIKMSSPAYKLPKSRNASEMGLAIKPTNSNNRLNGINTGWLKGCKVSSLTKP